MNHPCTCDKVTPAKHNLATALIVALLCVGGLLGTGALLDTAPHVRAAMKLGEMASVIYSADSATTYVATAPPGSLVTDPVWQVKKITATGGTSYPNQTIITWSGGSNSFTNRVGATAIGCESVLAANYE